MSSLNDYTKDKIPQQTRIISYDFRIRLQSRNHILVYTVQITVNLN